MIVFPELSLTGYELDLASALQFESGDARLERLSSAAKEYDMHVVAGAPWVSGREKPYLGAFLFAPDRSACYAKIHVHESEQAYFVPGDDHCVEPVGGVPTGLAICADTGHPDHAAEAAALGARLYVASVMKNAAQYRAHADNLSRYAADHGMAVLTANYAGSTGGEESAGGSAFWDERGRLVARADSNDEALVVARRIHDGWRGEVVMHPAIEVESRQA